MRGGLMRLGWRGYDCASHGRMNDQPDPVEVEVPVGSRLLSESAAVAAGRLGERAVLALDQAAWVRTNRHERQSCPPAKLGWRAAALQSGRKST